MRLQRGGAAALSLGLRKRDPHNVREVLRALAAGFTIQDTADEHQVDRGTVRNWLKKVANDRANRPEWEAVIRRFDTQGQENIRRVLRRLASDTGDWVG